MEEVRILAPTGHVAYVPKQNLQAALDAGATLLTPDKMRTMRQDIFMQHSIFKEEHKPRNFGRRRKSLVKRSR